MNDAPAHVSVERGEQRRGKPCRLDRAGARMEVALRHDEAARVKEPAELRDWDVREERAVNC